MRSFVSLFVLLTISTSLPQGVYAQVPNAPNNIRLQVFDYGYMRILWTDQSSDELGFVVERKEDGGSYVVLDSVGTSANTERVFSDSTVQPNTTYYYRIAAYNGGGMSAYATEAFATTPPVSGTWTMLQDPSEQTGTLGWHGVSFGDSLNGMAVGVLRSVLKTTDGGSSWTASELTGAVSNATLRDIDMIDASNAFVVGSTGLVASTTDGGATWSISAPSAFEDYRGVDFLDSQKGVIVNSAGTVYGTTDGGSSWQTLFTKTATWSAVRYVDDSTLVVVGYNGTLAMSTDGGTAWTDKTETIDWQGQLAQNIYAVDFYDRQNGYAVGQNIVLRTTDGGDTWTAVPNAPATNHYGVKTLDATTLLTVAGYGAGATASRGDSSYVSKDGGVTWTATATGLTSLYGTLFDLTMQSPTTAVAAGGGYHVVQANVSQYLIPDGAPNVAAAYFDGTGDRIRVVDGAPANPSANEVAYKITGNTISMEAWVYPMDTPPPGEVKLIMGRPADGGIGMNPFQTFSLMIIGADQIADSPRLAATFSDGVSTIGNPGEIAVRDVAEVTLGEWTHVAGTYDGTTVKLYINGNLVSQLPFTANIGTGSTGLYIGGYTYGYFKGLVDDVRLWNVTRSASDIAAYKGLTLQGTETGLVGYWPMDSTYAVNNQIATPDLTANKNDLYVQFDAHLKDLPQGSTVQITPTRLIAQKASGDALYAVTGSAYASRLTGDGWPVPTISNISVPAEITMNGDSLTFTPADNFFGVKEIIGTATNAAGTVTDTLYLYVEAIRTAENEVSLDVTNRGKVGAFGQYGKGMRFGGTAGLAAGDFSLVDRNDGKFAGGLYASLNSFNPTAGFSSVASQLSGFAAFSSSMNDGWEPNPIGVNIEQVVHYDTTAPNNSFVVLEYRVTNTSGAAIDDLFAQMTGDFDVGAYANNMGGFDSTLGLSYAYEADGASDGSYYGIVALGQPVAGHAVFLNGDGPNYIRSTSNLTTFTPDRTTGADTRNQISVGPMNIDAGATKSVYLAYAAGADLNALKAAAQAAHNALATPGAPNIASAYFDGTGDRIRVVDGAPANPSANEAAYKISGNTITMEAWVYPMDTPAPGQVKLIMGRPADGGIGVNPFQTFSLMIIGADQFSSEPVLAATFSDGVSTIGNPGEIAIRDTSGVTIGEWTHVAGSYDGSTVKLYINGNLVRQLPFTANLGNGSTGLYIGGYTYGYFKGLIDDVRLWNVTRSAGDIATYKNLTLQGTESGLAGYWPMDSTYAVNNQTATPDLTANKNDLYVQFDARLEQFPQGSTVQIAPTRLVLQTDTRDPLYAVTGVPYAARVTGDGWPEPTVSNIQLPNPVNVNADSISFTPAPGFYGPQEISGTLSNVAGSNVDTVYLYVEELRTVSNQISLDVANRGKAGAFAQFGKGMRFAGKTGLSAADFSLVDRNDTKFAGGLYAAFNSFNPTAPFSDVASQLPGFTAFRSEMDDAWEPSRIGVTVEQVVHSDTTAPNNGFVIMEYRVTNASGGTIDDLFAQMTGDFDVGSYANNLGGYDSTLGLSYAYEADAANDSSYFGIMVLGSPVAGHAVFGGGQTPDFVRSTTNLTTFTQDPTTGADTRNQLTVGPMDLAAGETKSVMFAFVADESITGIVNAARAAHEAVKPPAPPSIASAYFDGMQDRIRVVQGAPANPTANEAAYQISGNTISMEAWVYPMATPRPGDVSVIMARPADNGIGSNPFQTFGLLIIGADQFSSVPVLAAAFSDGVSPIPTSNEIAVRDTSAVKIGEWTHVAGTYDGTHVRLYINGGLVREFPFTTALGSGSTGLYIGGMTYGYFDGLIDEVRLWNVARSGNDITGAKDVTLSGSETGLAGYWPMDSTYALSGQTVTPDRSPNGNDLYVQFDSKLLPFVPGSVVQIAPTRLVLHRATGRDPLYGVTGSEYHVRFSADGWPRPTISNITGPSGAVVAGDSLVWTPGAEEYGGYDITATATNTAGTLVDTVHLFVEGIRRAENAIALDVSNRGKLGAWGDYGKGLFYKGNNALYGADFSLVDRNDAKFAGGLYTRQNSLQALTGFNHAVSSLSGFTAFSSTMDDAWEPNRIGVSVDQIVHVDTSAVNRNFILLQYRIANVSGGPLDDLFAQATADFDIEDPSTNLGGFDSTLGLTYAWSSVGNTDSAYYGIMALGRPVAGHAIFPGADLGRYVRSTTDLTTFTADPVGALETRNQLSVGPMAISTADTIDVWFVYLAADDLAGLKMAAEQAKSLLGPTTSVEDEMGIPEQFALDQNFPNPFNPSTNIRFSLPVASSVRVDVFNILGQTVAVLQEGDLQAGYHTVQWNAGVATGLYFYRIEATSASDPGMKFSQVKKMMLVK